jgi:hypothetical protein
MAQSLPNETMILLMQKKEVVVHLSKRKTLHLIKIMLVVTN